MEAIEIQNGAGERLEIETEFEDGREVATIHIDEVPYHIERISAKMLMSDYCVDTDPDYLPNTDLNGKCVIVAPFSGR